jgi:hypothetical protein
MIALLVSPAGCLLLVTIIVLVAMPVVVAELLAAAVEDS